MKHPIQIFIPQPCSEDWNNMTPQEQGRFCDSYQKCVVDFTNFSDAELYQYLLANKGKKACGRFRPSQLNRPIHIPHQPHSRLYKWIIAAGLALVLVQAPNNTGFAKAPLTCLVSDSENKDDNKPAGNDSNTFNIRGVVLNDQGKAMAGARITAERNYTIEGSTITGVDGSFTIKLKKGAYYLNVEYPGYTSLEKIINTNRDTNRQIVINMEEDLPMLGGFMTCPPVVTPLITPQQN